MRLFSNISPIAPEFGRFLSLIVAIALTALVAAGCGGPGRESSASRDSLQTIEPPFQVSRAKNFSVSFYENFKLLTIKNPWKGTDRNFTYLLAENPDQIPDDIHADAVVKIPLQSVVCISTSHVALLEYLGESDKLAGFPNARLISSPEARKRVEEGKVTDLGSELDVNVELVLTLRPGAVVAFGGGQFNSNFNLVMNAGIPVVWNADFMEPDPLGRAEWIKCMSLFFNKERQADSIFSRIERNYDSLKSLAAGADRWPTVFCGIVYGDGWFMPGGQNYAAKFFKDAGADYVWKDNPDEAYITLSFEAVYEKALDADFWLGVGSFDTFEEMRRTDARYGAFAAFKNRRVYNYGARIGEGGGNDYFETGYLRPDIILADLIGIFHPELLPGRRLYFYKQLK